MNFKLKKTRGEFYPKVGMYFKYLPGVYKIIKVNKETSDYCWVHPDTDRVLRSTNQLCNDNFIKYVIAKEYVILGEYDEEIPYILREFEN